MSFDEEGFLSEQASAFCAPHRKLYPALFELFDDLNRYAHIKKFSINGNGTDLQEIVCSCLFLRILNSYAASVRLAELGLCLDSEAICRVAMEALFYMKACADKREVAKKYVESDQHVRLKFLNVAEDKKSSLHALFHSGAIEDVAAVHEALKKEVEEEKIQELKAWGAAEDAKLGEMYDYAYRLLSSSVHTSPRAIDRLAKTNIEGEVVEVTPGPESDKIPLTLFTATSVLMVSLMCVRDFFRVEMPELETFEARFKKLDAEFNSSKPS